MNKFLTFLALTLLSGSLAAEVAQVDAFRVSGGHVKEFVNREFRPSARPLPLPKVTNPTDEQRRIAERAERVLKNNAALAIMLIDRGRIVYEGYREPASETTTQFSYSMSKSLTAYTIGAMHCNGQIANLDLPAERYAPELRGTVYGQATVRNLLTMSSGVKDAVHSGSRYANEFSDLRSHVLSIAELLKKYPDRDMGLFGEQPSGRDFRYSATDTYSLALVGDGVGGFLNGYERYIWSRAGTESASYWLLDRSSRAIAAAGISATMRDWARLAIFTVKELKYGSDCMRGFMAAATSKQLTNPGRIGRGFDSYGYQTWTNPKFGARRGFWWLGYGGQRVGIDPESERIIVVSSWREDYMEEVYGLFAEFQTIK